MVRITDLSCSEGLFASKCYLGLEASLEKWSTRTMTYCFLLFWSAMETWTLSFRVLANSACWAEYACSDWREWIVFIRSSKLCVVSFDRGWKYSRSICDNVAKGILRMLVILREHYSASDPCQMRVWVKEFSGRRIVLSREASSSSTTGNPWSLVCRIAPFFLMEQENQS